MKYEIIRKPMVLERVEVNLLKSEYCYLQRLPRVTVIFFKKNIDIHFFINLTVTLGNSLKIAQNHAKLSENVWHCMQ